MTTQTQSHLFFNSPVSADASSCAGTLEQEKLDIKNKTRASILPWKGQFSPQLVEHLLDRYCPRHANVLDAFCGSGTVLYECANRDFAAAGIDINPAAIMLAKTSIVCSQNHSDRKYLAHKCELFAASVIKHAADQQSINCREAVDVFGASNHTQIESTVLKSLLMLAFKNARFAGRNTFVRSLNQITRSLEQVPYSKAKLAVEMGDSRQTPFADNAFDYAVTSPPYINVTNYHQNYRPIIEALGFMPLSSAQAEIGANRKFRQNRFLTVVQYCMDMAMFLSEMARVLKRNGLITLVVGRVCSVQGVQFKNAELVADIAVDKLGGELADTQVRKFRNRYGELIYEEVLTIKPRRCLAKTAIEFGRTTGLCALVSARDSATADKKIEIDMAIKSGGSLSPSPFVL
ncbi:MAG: hypothetical protein K0U66_01980 [Gammaproteobacteria bacterium]|nr:hypothetical protein [Gammaproteobacteria bacterium]